MNNHMILYHGSQQIVANPQYGVGKPYNDYGVGFYCTENIELAKEWACPVKKDGYANQYVLRTNDLNILYLTRGSFHILNWLAILLKNRLFDINSNVGYNAREYIMEHFMPDVSNVDVMIGYRADDSYFSFAEDFLNNIISLQHLGNAMKLGKLGIQHVIISEKAFNKLHFESGEEVNQEIYYNKYCQRDLKAREDYSNSKIDLSINSSELYVRNIIMEGIKNGDPRL